jgi:hypothetical protein
MLPDQSSPQNPDRTAWTWAKKGKRELLFSDPDANTYSSKKIRVWTSFDGTQGTDIAYWLHDSKLAARVDLQPQSPSTLKSWTVFASALGWRTPSDLSVLSNLETADPAELTRESAKIMIGPHQFVEVPAFRWVLHRFRNGDGPEHMLVAWFDPANGWLPRMVSILPTMVVEKKAPLKLPEGAMMYGVAVEQYTTVLDPILGRERIFPSVIREYGVNCAVVTVTAIAVNESLSDALFVPEISPGALIVENAGSPAEKRTFSGGDTGSELYLKLQHEETRYRKPGNVKPVKPASPRSAPAVDATPRSSGISVSSTATVASLIVLALAVVLRLRT